jgi:hypothetical protein
VFSICAIPIGAIAFLLGLYILFTEFQLSERDKRRRGKAIRRMISDDILKPGLTDVLIVVLQITAGALVIAVVEWTIIVNQIDMTRTTLTSTGQLIPFVIGLANLVAVCWTCAGNFRTVIRQFQSSPRMRREPENRNLGEFHRTDHEEDRIGLIQR